MLNKLKANIEALSNDNIKDLDKYHGIAIFAVIDDSKDFYPRTAEHVYAIDSLKNIEEKDFTKKKALIIEALNKVITYRNSKAGFVKKTDDKMDTIELGLLMIEQNNIDFFKSKESHLTSQPHARLESYIKMSWGNGKIFIDFWPELKLPDSIKLEVLKFINQLE